MRCESRLLSGTAELAKVFREWCGKADDIRIVTAWATTDCAVCDCLTKARSKISTMVVGLDFYTTSPSFLNSFRSVIRIGNALNGGTFHPKLYLFEDAHGCCCVMGSSNFTSGGFREEHGTEYLRRGRKSRSVLPTGARLRRGTGEEFGFHHCTRNRGLP
jgi:hypothetical protein